MKPLCPPGSVLRVVFRRFFSQQFREIHISFVRTNLLLPAFVHIFTCWLAFQNCPATTSQGIKQIMSTIQLESTSAFGCDGGGGGRGAGGEIPNTIAKCAWEIECFILPLDCQMAPFVSAQETSCSLVRHCRAELNFEMVVISRHTQGLPKHFFYADISARSCSIEDIYYVTYIYIYTFCVFS